MSNLEKRLNEVKVLDDNGEVFYEIDILEKEDLISSFIEVSISEPDDFLKIKETLTRVGIANRHKKELYASCNILHKRGKYYITHFKEMNAMDGKEVEMYLDDYQRRNHITRLLKTWGLLDIINDESIKLVKGSELPINVYVLPYKEKKDWKLLQKYNIGEIKQGVSNGNK